MIVYQGDGGGVPRKTAHIFAKDADSSDVTIFGSTLAGNTQYSSDLDDIQNESYEIGWRDAVISNKNYPLLADMNGVMLTFSQQLAYLLQHGLAGWDKDTTYYTYDIVNESGILYICTIDENLNNAPSSLTGWAVYYDPNKEISNLPPFCVNSGSIDAEGNGNCLSYSGTTLTLAGNTTITNAQGTSYVIEVAKTLAMTTDGTYNIFASITDGSLMAYSNKIYRQPTQPTGENVATSANAISSGSYSGQNLSRAFDGSLTTFWGSSQVGSTAINGVAYIGNSGLTSPIKRVRIYQSYTGASTPTQDYCSSIKLQYSNDGSTWIDIQTVTDLTYQTWEEIDVQDYTPTGSTHSFRLLALTHPSNTGNWLVAELELLTIEDNTVWLDTSVRPLTSYKSNGDAWEEYTGVPVGTCTVASNTISAVKTFPYNYTEKFLVADASLPSNRYINLTLGASGASYTAPSNGWFVLDFIDTGSQGYIYSNVNNITKVSVSSIPNTLQPSATIPVKKGDILTVTYRNINTGASQIRFVYAEGCKEENE